MPTQAQLLMDLPDIICPTKVTFIPAIGGKWHARANIVWRGRAGSVYTRAALSGQELKDWLASKGLKEEMRQFYVARYLPDIERSINPFADGVRLPRAAASIGPR
jgi:hypothetical protein